MEESTSNQISLSAVTIHCWFASWLIAHIFSSSCLQMQNTLNLTVFQVEVVWVRFQTSLETLVFGILCFLCSSQHRLLAFC